MGRGALEGGWAGCLGGDDGDDTISDVCGAGSPMTLCSCVNMNDHMRPPPLLQGMKSRKEFV